MSETVSRGGVLALCVCAALAVSACGKRGNPMPPLQRIPAAPSELSVLRFGDEIAARFAVPSTNIDGQGPADIDRVELYAVTLDELPRAMEFIDPEDLREVATLVAAEPVHRPPPPLLPGDADPPAPTPEGAGVQQGAVVVVREALTPETLTPVTLPLSDVPRSLTEVDLEVPRPFGAIVDRGGPQRFYFAVAVSPRARYGPHSDLLPAPLGPTSSAPSEPAIEIGEDVMTLRWTPPADARGVEPPGDPNLLPSRPIVPGPPATTYEVYEIPPDASAESPEAVPTPLTPEPIGATEFTQSGIRLGVERCFYVRAVDENDGVRVRGPASPVACSPFADTFAPGPPRELVAVAVPGAISLIWEPSDADDLSGYLVLRGEVGGDTLTPLMTSPVTGLSYRDDTAQAGVRYVYAVLAVDEAGNRSEESNRIEETAQ